MYACTIVWEANGESKDPGAAMRMNVCQSSAIGEIHSVCLYVCVGIFKGMCTSSWTGAMASEIIYLIVYNWGDWDSVGATELLSLAAGGIHIAQVVLYKNIMKIKYCININIFQ